jgi:hypothetical protein
MIATGPATWSRSLVAAVDVFVGVWLVAMIGLGLLTTHEIARLGSTSDSLLAISREEEHLAGALSPLRQIPIAGDQIASAQQELLQSSAQSARDAADARAAVDSLGNIAFGLVLLLAIFPVFAFYVPLRLTRRAFMRAALRGRPRQVA